MDDNDGQRPGGAADVTAQPRGFFRSNRGVAVLLLILTAGLFLNIWTSDWAHTELRDGFLLGGFPMFALLLMALSLLMLVLDGESRSVEPDVASLTLHVSLIVLCVAIVIGAVFWSFDIIGFVPAVTLFILVFSTLLGYRPVWSAALVGLVVASALRGIMYALSVEIPDGLILGAILAGGQ